MKVGHHHLLVLVAWGPPTLAAGCHSLVGHPLGLVGCHPLDCHHLLETMAGCHSLLGHLLAPAGWDLGCHLLDCHLGLVKVGHHHLLVGCHHLDCHLGLAGFVDLACQSLQWPRLLAHHKVLPVGAFCKSDQSLVDL